MSSENPYELPAPSVVADLCAQRAWDDEIDDDTRVRQQRKGPVVRTGCRLSCDHLNSTCFSWDASDVALGLQLLNVTCRSVVVFDR